MTKYIINSEQMAQLWKEGQYDIIDEVRSHDLNTKLKEERELVFNKIMILLSDLDLPCNMNPYDTVACIRSEIHQIQVSMG